MSDTNLLTWWARGAVRVELRIARGGYVVRTVRSGYRTAETPATWRETRTREIFERTAGEVAEAAGGASARSVKRSQTSQKPTAKRPAALACHLYSTPGALEAPSARGAEPAGMAHLGDGGVRC